MKKQYIISEVSVIRFDNDDIVTSSGLLNNTVGQDKELDFESMFLKDSWQ